MYADRENTASLNQVVTGTAVSTDSILVSGRNLGRGASVRALVQVTAAITGTLTVELIQSANADLSSYTVLHSKTAGANAAAGTRVMDTVMPTTSQPYLGFRYTGATGGSVTAELVLDTGTPAAERPTFYTGF